MLLPLSPSTIKISTVAYLLALCTIVAFSIKPQTRDRRSKLAIRLVLASTLCVLSALLILFPRILSQVIYIETILILLLVVELKLFPNIKNIDKIGMAIYVLSLAVLFKHYIDISTLVLCCFAGFILGFLLNTLSRTYLTPYLRVEYITVIITTVLIILCFLSGLVNLTLPVIALSLLLSYRRSSTLILTLLSGFVFSTAGYTYIVPSLGCLLASILSLVCRPRFRFRIEIPYTWIGTYVGGRYLCIDVVGLGGFSYVLKVSDEEGRVYAAKILKESYATNQRILQEFRDEMSRYIRLNLNHVIKVFEVHVPSQSRPYIEDPPYAIMELGKLSLRKLLLTRGKLGLDEFLKISLKLCEAIRELHYNGLVHLDLKPENVLIMDEKSFQIKLCDLGSAKESRGPVRITQISYLYAAPEMIRSFIGSTKSDIYSLGCIMYEMLTGRVPNEFILKNMPLPSLRSIRSDVPVELEELISRMLSVDPEARPDIDQVMRVLVYVSSRYSTSRTV